MNAMMTRLLHSAVSFFLALFFIFFGGVGVILPWSEPARQMLIRFIDDQSIALFLFGFSFIVVGISVLFQIAFDGSNHCYHFKIKGHGISVDEKLLQKLLEAFWQKQYPNQEVHCRLLLKNNAIYINADLPDIAVELRPSLLENLQTQLRDYFADALGYRNDFYLSASFRR